MSSSSTVGSLRNWSVTTQGVVLEDESQLSMTALRAALAQSEAMLTVSLQHGVEKRNRIQELEAVAQTRSLQWRQEIDRFNARTAAEFDSLRRGCSADTIALEGRRDAAAGEINLRGGDLVGWTIMLRVQGDEHTGGSTLRTGIVTRYRSRDGMYEIVCDAQADNDAETIAVKNLAAAGVRLLFSMELTKLASVSRAELLGSVARTVPAELTARLRSAVDGQARAEQALGDALALLDAEALVSGAGDPAADAAPAQLRAQLEQAQAQLTAERGRSAAIGESKQVLENEDGALRHELEELRAHDAALLADAQRSLEKAQHSLPAAQDELEKVHAAAARQAEELSAVRAELAASRRQVGATRAAGMVGAAVASAQRSVVPLPAAMVPLLSDESVRAGSCSQCDAGFDAWHRGCACSECKQLVCAQHFALVVVPAAEPGAARVQTVLCRACAAK